MIRLVDMVIDKKNYEQNILLQCPVMSSVLLALQQQVNA
jgi:hypothetical protein